MPDRTNIVENDNLPRAIVAIVGAVGVLSFGDAVIKAFSLNLPIWQLFVLRSLIVLPLLVAIQSIWLAQTTLRPTALTWVALRSLLLTLMLISYYLALPHLQFPVAAAAYYTAPILITLFSKLIAREPVGAKRWSAVGLGFAGALVTLRPDAGGFNGFVLLPIIAAFFYAAAMIVTRTRCHKEDAMALTAAMNVTIVVVGLVVSLGLTMIDLPPSAAAQNRFLFGAWTSFGLEEAGVLALLAGAFLTGSLFVAIAYQSADASTVSAFDYSYLAFSVVWGVLLFTQLPDVWTIVGICMIATAGLIALLAR